MKFRWNADDGPTLNAGYIDLWLLRGSGPVLLRDPIFLWFLGGRSPFPPYGSPGPVKTKTRLQITETTYTFFSCKVWILAVTYSLDTENARMRKCVGWLVPIFYACHVTKLGLLKTGVSICMFDKFVYSWITNFLHLNTRNTNQA